MADFYRFLVVVLVFAAMVISDKAVAKTVTAKKPSPVYHLAERLQVHTLNNWENTSDGEHLESQGLPLKGEKETPVSKRIVSENLQAQLQPIEILLFNSDILIRSEAIRQAAEGNKRIGRDFHEQKKGGNKDKKVYNVYKGEGGLSAPRLIGCYTIAGRHTGGMFCSKSCFIKDHFESESYFLAGCSGDIHPTGFEFEGYSKVYYCNESFCNKRSALWPWKVIQAPDSKTKIFQ